MRMTIAEKVAEALQSVVGSKVTGLSWADPVLVVDGESWQLQATCSWRVLRSGALWVGSDDENAQGALEAIRGRALVAAATTGSVLPLDPVLVFEEGLQLEVFSASAVEPWVVHVSGHPVFVASPTAPKVSE